MDKLFVAIPQPGRLTLMAARVAALVGALLGFLAGALTWQPELPGLSLFALLLGPLAFGSVGLVIGAIAGVLLDFCMSCPVWLPDADWARVPEPQRRSPKIWSSPFRDWFPQPA